MDIGKRGGSQQRRIRTRGSIIPQKGVLQGRLLGTPERAGAWRLPMTLRLFSINLGEISLGEVGSIKK